MGFPGGLMVKNLPANAGDARDAGLIPGLKRFLKEGNGNSVQYSCLENPIDRGAWWSTVHRVAKSQTRLKQLSTVHKGTLMKVHKRKVTMTTAKLVVIHSQYFFQGLQSPQR